MAPHTAPQGDQQHSSGEAPEAQFIFIIRHGDRWDYSHPEWLKTAQRKGDPPLSTLGHQQSRETGSFLDSVFAEEGLSGDNITWLCSPFLRTIQTSNDMINSFRKVDMDSVQIHPENSVWELDGHDGKLHACLPPIEERQIYFPRVNVGHESLFTPSLPERRSEFLARCDRAVAALNSRFHFRPRTAIVIVSHAAACVGLARAAANATLQDLNPAGPCGIYRLTRTSQTPVWDLDHYSSNGMNAYSKHLSDVGNTTVPWNHFGDKEVNKGYTGPPMENDEL